VTGICDRRVTLGIHRPRRVVTCLDRPRRILVARVDRRMPVRVGVRRHDIRPRISSGGGRVRAAVRRRHILEVDDVDAASGH
jgi:hypothetical protein